MHNKEPLTRDEVVLSLKQWKDLKAKELIVAQISGINLFENYGE